MKRTSYLVTLLVSVLSVVACAGKPQRPPMEDDIFVTNIKPDGTKLFSYSIATRSPKGGEGNRGGRGPSQGRDMPPSSQRQGNRDMGSGQRNGRKDPYVALNEGLEAKLVETNYCRDGYFQLDTHESESRIHLLGECKESATEQDRTQFPNQN